MNEKSRRIVAVLLISAVAALVASPFAPAFASDSGQAGAEASFAAGTVGEEEAAGEVAAPAIRGMAAPEAGATSDGITAGSMTRPGGEQGEPWEVTSLDISKDVDTVTAPGVEIGLEKAASRSRIEMSVGDKAEVAFTIDVSAEWSDSYYIDGDFFVAYTGEWPADVTAVSDTVWYKAGGPSWLAAASSIGTTVPLGDDAIPTGGPHTYSYSGTFTLPVPLASVTALSNLIEITISNKPDPPKPGMRSWTFRYREDFAKPAGGGPTMVSLQDIEGITPSDGLSHEVRKVTLNGAETADLTGPWALDLAVSPFTVVIEKELSAEKAGRYTLHNKAKIGELEDEADVDIVVTQDVRPGSITGFKYEDLDADGELDVGEPPFKGIAIELWREGLSAEVAASGGVGPLGAATWLKVGEAATAADGSYRFGGLEPGYYMVREILPDGVFASGPLEVFAGVDAGQDVVVETPFLNYRLGGVTVHKWLDLDGDGVHQESEPPLAGVKVILEGGGLSEESVTGAAGTVAFMDLHPGAYLVREELPGGYRATSAVE